MALVQFRPWGPDVDVYHVYARSVVARIQEQYVAPKDRYAVGNRTYSVRVYGAPGSGNHPVTVDGFASRDEAERYCTHNQDFAGLLVKQGWHDETRPRVRNPSTRRNPHTANKHSVLEEVRAAVGKRNSEAGELAAATQVLAKHGSRTKPTISTTRDAKGAAVRIYYWKDSPAGAFALVGGPSFQGKVYTDAELRDTKVPAGFYIEAGAGSDRDDRRVSEILARAGRTKGSKGSKGSKGLTSALLRWAIVDVASGSVDDRVQTKAEAERSRDMLARSEGRRKRIEPIDPPMPADRDRAPAPSRPKITGVRSGGRAPYLPGVETVHGRRPPKITGVREGGKAPFRVGQATRYGTVPKPAPSGDVGARVQAALAAVLAQLQAS